jgi:hypothetical protein
MIDDRLHTYGQYAKEAFHAAKSDPKGLLYWGAISSLAILLLLVQAVKFFKAKSWRVRRQSLTPSTPQLEKVSNSVFKAPARKPGGEFTLASLCCHSWENLEVERREALQESGDRCERCGLMVIVWEPVDFSMPVIEEYEGFDVMKTKPNAYRPFRNGPYHITMGLRNMKWNEWIGKYIYFLEMEWEARGLPGCCFPGLLDKG